MTPARQQIDGQAASKQMASQVDRSQAHSQGHQATCKLQTESDFFQYLFFFFYSIFFYSSIFEVFQT